MVVFANTLRWAVVVINGILLAQIVLLGRDLLFPLKRRALLGKIPMPVRLLGIAYIGYLLLGTAVTMSHYDRSLTYRTPSYLLLGIISLVGTLKLRTLASSVDPSPTEEVPSARVPPGNA